MHADGTSTRFRQNRLQVMPLADCPLLYLRQIAVARGIQDAFRKRRGQLLREIEQTGAK